MAVCKHSNTRTRTRTHLYAPALVEINDEDDVITQTREAVGRWHVDDEREHVVNEGVERLVHEGTPGQVGHRLELVVDKQLRRHLDEPFEQRVSE